MIFCDRLQHTVEAPLAFMALQMAHATQAQMLKYPISVAHVQQLMTTIECNT